MAKWQRHLDLSDLFRGYENREVSIQEVCAGVSKRLLALRDFPLKFADLNERREEIADEFKSLSEDDTTDVDDFDEVMSWLYDWADTQMGEFALSRTPKACWVKTSI